MKKQYKFLILLAVVIVGIIAWYLGSPLFIDKRVNEDIIIVPDASKDQDAAVTLLSQGSFVGADSLHQVKGTAKVVEKEGKRYVVLENFESTNGPDLKVYLAADAKATEFVSLGALKGNIGNQQYEFSKEVDLEKYKYVLIWCRAFSVLFGSAELTSS